MTTNYANFDDAGPVADDNHNGLRQLVDRITGSNVDTLVGSLPRPVFTKRIITIVGGYGSGKSEVAVNLATHLAESDRKTVSIADLDIVNPYFRSREAIEALNQWNIKSIVPPGGQRYAELPIILPEVKGAIEREDGILILDVGGDETGARLLGSLSNAFRPDSYELLYVVNSSRPLTATVEENVELMQQIEQAGRLKFTGLIANTHMLENTTDDILLDGLKIAREISDETDVPILFISGLAEIIENISHERLNLPVLSLNRMLLKPWEKKN